MFSYYLRLLFSAQAYADWLAQGGGAGLAALWTKLKVYLRGALGMIAMAAASPTAGWGQLSAHPELAPLAMGLSNLISGGEKNDTIDVTGAKATPEQLRAFVEKLLPHLQPVLTPPAPTPPPA